jgi:hypothetical protein
LAATDCAFCALAVTWNAVEGARPLSKPLRNVAMLSASLGVRLNFCTPGDPITCCSATSRTLPNAPPWPRPEPSSVRVPNSPPMKYGGDSRSTRPRSCGTLVVGAIVPSSDSITSPELPSGSVWQLAHVRLPSTGLFMNRSAPASSATVGRRFCASRGFGR